ncbi:hypothetical protein Gotur_032679 [Gossypium turneri]
MGNALRLLYGKCLEAVVITEGGSVEPRYTTTAPGVSALARDLFNFESTSLVPEDLSQHVVSSRKAQVKWYRKLLQAWKEAKPRPKTPEEVATLIVETLSRHQKADVEGLLEFYDLPHPTIFEEIFIGVPTRLPEAVEFVMHTLPMSILDYPQVLSSVIPEETKEIHKMLLSSVTFWGSLWTTRYKSLGIIDNRHSEYNTSTVEVDGNTVPDGDGLYVYVNTDDPRESSNIPRAVLMAAVQRSEARAMKNYTRADELRQNIIQSGYQVIDFQNEQILARKYRIRLRGIDAPEMLMPFGEEAKQELAKLVHGKCLRVLVPEDLSQHVVSSRKAQFKWYGKLLQAWKEAKPPPKTPEEVARLIVETLSRHQKADVEGLLEFYDLPRPSILEKISTGVPTRLPERVEFEMHTLPARILNAISIFSVNFWGSLRTTRDKNPGIIDNRLSEHNTSTVEVDGNTVPDGDGLNVYVNTDDPRESSNIPRAVLMAAGHRLSKRTDSCSKVSDSTERINRGIDAPEMLMPFGKEAKQELAKLVHGKCLRVLVYGEDQYGRCVADIYCNGIFAQEVMLKKGLAWHYVAYDQRVEFATVMAKRGSGKENRPLGTIKPGEAMEMEEEEQTRSFTLPLILGFCCLPREDLKMGNALRLLYTHFCKPTTTAGDAGSFGSHGGVSALAHDIFQFELTSQEVMLKKGLAWHYVAYDQRVEFATVMAKRGSGKENRPLGTIKPGEAMGMEEEEQTIR